MINALFFAAAMAAAVAAKPSSAAPTQPPPPAAALMISGYPISWPSATTASAVRMGSVAPGMMGTPAACIAVRAEFPRL